jgi:hypothetical protein
MEFLIMAMLYYTGLGLTGILISPTGFGVFALNKEVSHPDCAKLLYPNALSFLLQLRFDPANAPVHVARMEIYS